MSGFGSYIPPGSKPKTPAEMEAEYDDLMREHRAPPKPNGSGDNGVDHGDIGEPPNYPEEPQPPPRVGRILTGDEFITGYTPPDWLIDGIVQAGRLYACTSLTGHGKTAVWLHHACMIQAGRMIGHLDAYQGNVLILAGENPEDLKARMHGMVGTYKLKPAQLPYVLPGNFPLTPAEADALLKEIDGIGVEFSLIIGDTAASFFPEPTGGEAADEKNNNQMGAYARTLRSLTQRAPGNPAVVVLSHPVKNAAADNLLPRGGGAFLNELDGNLTLWTRDKEITTLYWQGKIRGPDFTALSYRLRVVPTGLLDRKDRPEVTVVAEAIPEEEAADHAKQTLTNEDALLVAMRDHPDASLAALARHLEWINETGEPMRAKVQRARTNLEEAGMLDRARRGSPLRVSKRGTDYLEGLKKGVSGGVSQGF